MKINVRIRKWSQGRQMGFQFGADDIRALSEELTVPDRRNRYSSLGNFITRVQAGEHPDVYSRIVSIGVTEGKAIRIFGDVNHSISHTRNSIQNHIEVRPDQKDFQTWVRRHIGQEIVGEYLPGAKKDVLLLLTKKTDEEVVIANLEKRLQPNARRKLHQEDSRSRIGHYFEEMAAKWCKKTWPDFHVSWRYPYIDSEHEFLRERRIICDIDLVKNSQFRCVEVKSVKGLPGLPFIATASEWRSREVAKKTKNIEYTFLVFYYATLENYLHPILFDKVEKFVQREPVGWKVTPRLRE